MQNVNCTFGHNNTCDIFLTHQYSCQESDKWRVVSLSVFFTFMLFLYQINWVIKHPLHHSRQIAQMVMTVHANTIFKIRYSRYFIFAYLHARDTINKSKNNKRGMITGGDCFSLLCLSAQMCNVLDLKLNGCSSRVKFAFVSIHLCCIAFKVPCIHRISKDLKATGLLISKL